MLNESINLSMLEDQHTSGIYYKRDIEIIYGEGARLWDSEGNSYIDCVGGQGAANLGHRNPMILEALQQQADQLISCPEFFHNPVRAQYQAALCEAAGMLRVFLCNSGTESIEAAIKFARLTTGRTGILAAMRGFHGRTLGSLSATWNNTYRDPFLPLVPDFTHTPFNNIEKLAAALTPNTAAVLLEAVQGEGGVHPANSDFLSEAQRLCNENGTLLILDEIQTGFGRTGDLFAFQGYGIQPDLVCLAKSIAGGLPMGAVLIGDRIGALPAASHGTTFGGNPLACAVGIAVLKVLQGTSLIEHTRQRGETVLTQLGATLPESAVREVRGRGLLIGIELRTKVAPILKALQTRGVLALAAGQTVLRLLPPLVISDDELQQAVDVITEVLTDAV